MLKGIITTIIILLPTLLNAGNKTELYEICSREYNKCQSDCVFIQLKEQTTTSGTPVKCNPKNNIISQCRNKCYIEYIKCRRWGGKHEKNTPYMHIITGYKYTR